ncbi:MAG: MerR family transcriptional regulator [Actinoallomurus sp.]
MPDPSPWLTIGRVAERTDLSVHAPRSYEREGVLADPVRRDPRGRRVYSDNDVEWLSVCVILRASGMPLPAIRRYTELVRDEDGNEEERLVLLRRHRERVTAQIGDLTRCLDLINYKVGVYEDILTAVLLFTATDRPPESDLAPCAEPVGPA